MPTNNHNSKWYHGDFTSDHLKDLSLVPKEYRRFLLRSRHRNEGHLFEVVGDIPIYKKVYQGCHTTVLNLILPAGAVVRLSNMPNAKCRASFVFCPKYPGNVASTNHLYRFAYPKNTYIFPRKQNEWGLSNALGSIHPIPTHFTLGAKECASGIHFFFNEKKAWAWGH